MLRTVVALVAVCVASTMLVSCGGDGPSDAGTAAEASRTIDVTATEYAFDGDPGTITAGDTIEFAVENLGQLDHMLEVLSPQGRSLGRTQRIPAGSTDRVTVTFEDAGAYRLICDIDDHQSRGQTAGLTVG